MAYWDLGGDSIDSPLQHSGRLLGHFPRPRSRGIPRIHSQKYCTCLIRVTSAQLQLIGHGFKSYHILPLKSLVRIITPTTMSACYLKHHTAYPSTCINVFISLCIYGLIQYQTIVLLGPCLIFVLHNLPIKDSSHDSGVPSRKKKHGLQWKIIMFNRTYI